MVHFLSNFSLPGSFFSKKTNPTLGGQTNKRRGKKGLSLNEGPLMGCGVGPKPKLCGWLVEYQVRARRKVFWGVCITEKLSRHCCGSWRVWIPRILKFLFFPYPFLWSFQLATLPNWAYNRWRELYIIIWWSSIGQYCLVYAHVCWELQCAVCRRYLTNTGTENLITLPVSSIRTQPQIPNHQFHKEQTKQHPLP